MLENVYFVEAGSTPFIIETVMGKIHFCSDALQCLFPVAPAAGLIVMVYIYSQKICKVLSTATAGLIL